MRVRCYQSLLHVTQWQSRMFTKHRDLSPIQMMFVMNAFSTVFSLITLVHADELVPFFHFVGAHPEIHLHFIAFSTLSTIGKQHHVACTDV
jgi:solute carrier family 35 (adenosine 3'-phospho 5'-phosphosulfate transporter), member B2